MYTPQPPSPPPPWKIYLRVLIFICGKLFLFMITCENLFFCENIFPSMIISDNLFEAFLFARIAFYLCPSVKMSSYLSSFHKCVHFIKHVFKVMVLEYIFWGSAPLMKQFSNIFFEGAIILVGFLINDCWLM